MHGSAPCPAPPRPQHQRDGRPRHGQAQELAASFPHGSGPLLRRHPVGLHAKHFPRDVIAQLLAGDDLVGPLRAGTGLALDQRAVFRRHAIAKPGLHGLVSAARDVEGDGGFHRATEKGDRSIGRDLARGSVFHGQESMLVPLVLLDSLALPRCRTHEKLAAMSIHEEIKTRRLARGWSHEQLAKAVSKAEGREDAPLSWQTVQQWEKTTAPSRKRLPYVAAALGCTVPELLGIVTMNFDAEMERALGDIKKSPARDVGPAPPPLPPRDFKDRHEVSDSDWGLLQDVHLVMTDDELEALRTRAERLRRIAHEQLEAVVAPPPPGGQGWGRFQVRQDAIGPARPSKKRASE